MKPICLPCQRFYRVKRNGYPFIEGMPFGGYAPPGKEAPEKWRPYKLWVGDLWECMGCGHQLVSGVAYQPRSEQHEPDFEQKVRSYGQVVQINDC
jgi:Zn ribbon nucleic-acid-binding protein